MNYFDFYKRKNMPKGKNESDRIMFETKNFINMEFMNDASYRLAKVLPKSLMETEIDIRIKNTDKPHEKLIYFTPDTIANPGDYLSFDNSSYLLTDFESNSVMPYSKATKCDHTIKLGNVDFPVMAFVEGESYGVKIVASNDIVTNIDTKIRVTIQRNRVTENVVPNTRFMVGNSKFGIYEIADITVYKEGLLQFTCKKDTYMEGYDDIENNKAYNDFEIPKDPEIEYELLGEEEIRKGIKYKYTINPQSGNCDWIIDNSSVATMNIIDKYNIELVGNIVGEFVTLTASVDGEIYQKDVLVVR